MKNMLLRIALVLLGGILAAGLLIGAAFLFAGEKNPLDLLLILSLAAFFVGGFGGVKSGFRRSPQPVGSLTGGTMPPSTLVDIAMSGPPEEDHGGPDDPRNRPRAALFQFWMLPVMAALGGILAFLSLFLFSKIL